jgi:hypothetical protein
MVPIDRVSPISTQEYKLVSLLLPPLFARFNTLSYLLITTPPLDDNQTVYSF